MGFLPVAGGSLSGKISRRTAVCPKTGSVSSFTGGLGGSPLVAQVRSQTVQNRAVVTAKIYDWKKRGNEKYSGEMEPGTMAMHTLFPAPGSTHRKKRVGRGVAAGQGRSAGLGMRGQKSRSGAKGVRIGFEGGQTPLYRKVSKWVGRPMGPGHQKVEYGIIKLEYLSKCPDGAEVSYEYLLGEGHITKIKRKLVKVVGGTELTAKNLTVRAHAFTTSAVEAIEASGGKCILLNPTTGEDIILDDDSTSTGDESETMSEESSGASE
eukprot:CAMPEP_0184681378 /NCGR_PEP_ID=MMETSP0312-20130426/4343_1 /TAXON_ID=31354 /ORGANISM="Compsopogon coeruleus, Strain SAG 36.94" /LENGTH=264 /DNA_ID=CAMNT_0027132163 /DNA_START=239 /DNA_END=1033 /DNA_ORIENTATION=+